MRLPSPLAAYRRWRLRRRCEAAGIDPEFAEQLNEVGRKASQAGKEATAALSAILAQAVSEGRDAFQSLADAMVAENARHCPVCGGQHDASAPTV